MGNAPHDGNVDDSRAGAGSNASSSPRRNRRGNGLPNRAGAGNRAPAAGRGARDRTEEPNGNRADAMATHDQTHHSYRNMNPLASRHLPRNPAARRGVGTQPYARVGGVFGNASERAQHPRRGALRRPNADRDGNRLGNDTARPDHRHRVNGNVGGARSRPRGNGRHTGAHNGRAGGRRTARAPAAGAPHGRYYDDPEGYLLSHRQPPRQVTAPKVRYKKPKYAARNPLTAARSAEDKRNEAAAAGPDGGQAEAGNPTP